MGERIPIEFDKISAGIKGPSVSTLWKITIIFLLSFVSALLYSQLAGRTITRLSAMSGDSVEYDGIAINFLKGYGLSSYGPISQGVIVNAEQPTAQMRREPLYPLFLAAIYFLFGHSALPVIMAQFIIYGLICSIIYLTGKIVFSEKVAFWGSIVLAAHPNTALIFSQIGQESLATLFSALSIFLLVFSAIKDERKYLISSAIFLSLSVLTRSVLLLFPLVTIFYFLVTMGRRKALLSWAVFCLVFSSIAVLWPIRNYRALGYFAFTSMMGDVLYVRTSFIGDSKDKTTLFDPSVKKLAFDLNRSYAKMVTEYKRLYLVHKSEVEVSRALLREALEKIGSHPAEYLIGVLPPLQRMVFENHSQQFVPMSFDEALASRAYGIVFLKIILRLIYSLPYLLMALAFILMRSFWKKWWLLFIFITYTLLINSLLVGSYVRHIINIYPYVILFAVAFVTCLRKEDKRHEKAKSWAYH